MAADLEAKMLANPASGAVAGPALTAWCLAIGQWAYNQLTNNAVVVPTLLVAPTGGGPVTGTGGIT